jgi:hypothetical protein
VFIARTPINTFVSNSGPAERIPQLAELQEYQKQIAKAWITGRIAEKIYADQIRKVGTGLAAAGLLEGEAVLDLVEFWRPQGDSNPRYRRERAMS